MAKQPEAKLVKRITAEVKKRGGHSFKIHGGDNPFQAVGIPDQLVCFIGQFIGIEAKMPGEPLRPAQRVALGEIYRAGGVAAVVETFEQAKQLLSYCEDRRNPEVPMCFDRGRISARWTGFRDP
jgi:hypothetical protein